VSFNLSISCDTQWDDLHQRNIVGG